MSRLRIAFLTLGTPDRRYWSGTPYFMMRALERHCGETVSLTPPRVPAVTFPARLADRVLRGLTGRRFDPLHTRLLARHCGAFLQERLRRERFDLLFCCSAAAALPLLKSPLPVAYCTDATFDLLTDYTPPLTGLLSRSRRQGHLIEQRAIDRADLLLYPTPWAAASAAHDFDAPPDNIHVIPFGANLDEPPPADVITRRNPSPTCRLLFLAKTGWHLKGGDIAVSALRALEQRGIPAELTVCGCTPPEDCTHPRMTVIPFLDKERHDDRLRFRQLLLESDVLILPTRVDCFGVVFCEAAAYGLPVIAAATGGVSGVVTHGENGLLLPADATGAAYSDQIAGLWLNRERYAEMARKSRAIFEARLNWDAWGRAVTPLLTSIVRERG